jgi:hypothetical protein
MKWLYLIPITFTALIIAVEGPVAIAVWRGSK